MIRVFLIISKFLGKPLNSLIRFFLRSAAIFAISAFIFVLTFATFFFLTPEISLRESRIREMLELFLPERIQVQFSKADIRIIRVNKQPFAKRIILQFENLCVNYRDQAVDVCADATHLSFTGGFLGKSKKEEKWYLPRLIRIDPVTVLNSKILIDLPKIRSVRKSGTNESVRGFDFFSFLRTEILPKWKMIGSRVEASDFLIRTSQDSAYRAVFDLTTSSREEAVLMQLYNLKSLSSGLTASGQITLKRPEHWINGRHDLDSEKLDPWKVLAKVKVILGKSVQAKRILDIESRADIRNWRSFDFTFDSKVSGIYALNQFKLSGRFERDNLSGTISMKLGQTRAVIRSLEFLNCEISADLASKIGGVICGPEKVKMVTREIPALRGRRAGLFVFYPEFELRATRIDFGKLSTADFNLNLRLLHQDLIEATSQVTGYFNQTEKGWNYRIDGNLDFGTSSFKNLVALLAASRFAVPAPFNILDGKIRLASRVALDPAGGKVLYRLTTDLSSKGQIARLRLGGETDFVRTPQDGLTPYSNATLMIDSLRLVAPRFDLAAPPRLRPDNRFKSFSSKIPEDPFIREQRLKRPLNVRLRLKTTSPKAIRIATNLTKEPIPIDLDLVYDDRSGKPRPKTTGSTRAPASVTTSDTPQLTGTFIIGQTPMDIFRRNAVLNELRIDLLETGQRKLNGRIEVSYLEYQIQILLLGQVSDPKVIFASEPPLDDDQVISVLLFGRPLEDLGKEEKTSVSSLHSAVANAALGLTSLYFLASTPIESIGYDPEKGSVTARVGLGGGATLEFGTVGAQSLAQGRGRGTVIGFSKRIAPDWVFRSEVERIGSASRRTVSALIEWVKRF